MRSTGFFAAFFLCAVSLLSPAKAEKPAGQMSLPDQMKELYYGPITVPSNAPQPALNDDGPMGSNFGMECNTCRGGVYTPSFTAVPVKLRGMWGAPDCGETVDLLYQTKYFTTWAGPEGRACMEIFIRSVPYGPNIHIETTSGEVFLQFTNDGLMRTGSVDPELGFDKDLAKDPDADISDIVKTEGREYAQCGLLPSTVDPAMHDVMRLMENLDGMVDACYTANSPLPLADNKKCQNWLFAFADADSSGTLKRDEIEDAAYAALATYALTLECTTLPRTQEKNMEDVITAADMLLSGLDANHDYALDRGEVSVLYAKGELPEEVGDKLMVLQEVFPFLREKTYDFAPAGLAE